MLACRLAKLLWLNLALIVSLRNAVDASMVAEFVRIRISMVVEFVRIRILQFPSEFSRIRLQG
jgi:hypothetical protein